MTGFGSVGNYFDFFFVLMRRFGFRRSDVSQKITDIPGSSFLQHIFSDVKANAAGPHADNGFAGRSLCLRQSIDSMQSALQWFLCRCLIIRSDFKNSFLY